MADAVDRAVGFPPGFFRRIDESGDPDFYREPRLVTHLDAASLGALTALYRELGFEAVNRQRMTLSL